MYAYVFFSSLWININSKITSKKWKIDSQLECIIYYEGFDFYSKMKKINENNGQRMRAAKQVREQLDG